MNNASKLLSGIAVLLVLCFASYTIGQWGRKSVESQYSADMKKWEQDRKTTLAHADSIQKALKIVDSARAQLAVKVAQKDDRIKVLTASSKTQHTTNGTKLDSIANAPLDDSCHEVFKVATALREETDTLHALVQVLESRDTLRVRDISLLTTQKSLLQTQSDSLRKLVITVPKYKAPKLLGFIPMPSRKATFVVGAVAGLATGIYVTR